MPLMDVPIEDSDPPQHDTSSIPSHAETNEQSEPSPWYCDFCETGFFQKKHYIQHCRSYHPMCTLCETRFKDIKALRSHHKTDHSYEYYECHKCKQMFSSDSKLHQHLDRHYRKSVIRCDEQNCGEIFHTKGELWKHNCMVHANVKCIICAQGISSHAGLIMHLKQTHGENSIMEVIWDKKKLKMIKAIQAKLTVAAKHTQNVPCGGEHIDSMPIDNSNPPQSIDSSGIAPKASQHVSEKVIKALQAKLTESAKHTQNVPCGREHIGSTSIDNSNSPPSNENSGTDPKEVGENCDILWSNESEASKPTVKLEFDTDVPIVIIGPDFSVENFKQDAKPHTQTSSYFYCTYCKLAIINNENYRIHNQYYHPICNVCGIQCPDIKNLRSHQKREHSFEECPMCTEHFESTFKLSQHLKSVKDPVLFKYDKDNCTEIFHTSDDLLKHDVNEHMGNKCPICRVSTVSQWGMVKHMRTAHQIDWETNQQFVLHNNKPVLKTPTNATTHGKRALSIAGNDSNSACIKNDDVSQDSYEPNIPFPIELNNGTDGNMQPKIKEKNSDVWSLERFGEICASTTPTKIEVDDVNPTVDFQDVTSPSMQDTANEITIQINPDYMNSSTQEAEDILTEIKMESNTNEEGNNIVLRESPKEEVIETFGNALIKLENGESCAPRDKAENTKECIDIQDENDAQLNKVRAVDAFKMEYQPIEIAPEVDKNEFEISSEISKNDSICDTDKRDPNEKGYTDIRDDHDALLNRYSGHDAIKVENSPLEIAPEIADENDFENVPVLKEENDFKLDLQDNIETPELNILNIVNPIMEISHINAANINNDSSTETVQENAEITHDGTHFPTPIERDGSEPLYYCCEFCNINFFNNVHYRQHVHSHHPICTKCTIHFPDIKMLQFHEVDQHSYHPCVGCDLTFPTLYDLNKHTQSLQGSALFRCSHADCSHIFHTAEEGAKHILEEHSVSKCIICAQGIGGENTLEQHLKDAHQTDCEAFQMAGPSANKTLNIIPKTTEASIDIDHCSKNLTKNKDNIFLPEPFHGQMQDYCNSCGVKFMDNHHFNLHCEIGCVATKPVNITLENSEPITDVDGSKNFQIVTDIFKPGLENLPECYCNFCATFIDRLNFKTHFQMHHPTCPICKVYTRSIESLQSHLKTHNNADILLPDPDYSTQLYCKFCDVTFIKNHHFKLHLWSHHPSCDICGILARNVKGLQSHKKSEHAHPSCPICNGCFGSNRAFSNHIQSSPATVFQCEEENCGLKYHKQADLLMHKKEHTPSRIRCIICHKLIKETLSHLKNSHQVDIINGEMTEISKTSKIISAQPSNIAVPHTDQNISSLSNIGPPNAKKSKTDSSVPPMSEQHEQNATSKHVQFYTTRNEENVGSSATENIMCSKCHTCFNSKVRWERHMWKCKKT